MSEDATTADRATVEVRPATAADARPMADLWLRSRKASVPDIPPPAHSDNEVRGFFTDKVVPEREAWVATSDDRLLALLVLDGIDIDQLYVEPELWTFQTNAGPRRFYERHGFVAVQFTDGDNEEGAPDVRYEWRPSP